MHRPAALSTLALNPSRLVGLIKDRMPSPRGAAKVGGILAAALATLSVLLVFSPIAHPRDLQVDGVTGTSASHIRSALEEAAGGQSTFMVSEAKLMQAVQDFPEVAAIDVHAHPPFRLDLTVVMRPPVGRVQVAGRSFVVAGDGTILERAGEASVPRIDASISNVRLGAGRVKGGRGALAVLAAAPEELLGFARTIRAGESGLEVVLSKGPRLIFGNGTAAKDKWIAAAAVIADGAAARATYIDLRVPSRPAVGGLGGSKAAGAEDAPPTLTAVSPEAAATTASLAAGRAASDRGTGLQSPTGTATDPAAAGSATAGAAPTGTGTASTGTATPVTPQQATPETSTETGNAPVVPSAGTSAGSGGATVGGGGAALSGTTP